MNTLHITVFFLALLAMCLTAQAAAPVYPITPLPYNLTALEPFIDTKTMDIHSNKLHQAYFTKCNAFVKALYEDPAFAPHRDTVFTPEAMADVFVFLRGPLNLIPAEQRQPIINQCGGLFNHNFFFDVMEPHGQEAPQMSQETAIKFVDLVEFIENQFKSFDDFKAQFKDSALAVFGSGWTWLTAHCGEAGEPSKVEIVNSKNQDLPETGIPIFALDVFEHAYFLKYYNDRGAYIDAFWSVANWSKVAENFAKACPASKKNNSREEL